MYVPNTSSYFRHHNIERDYVREAESLQGIPFRPRQKSRQGMDCSNLAVYLNRDFPGHPYDLDVGYYSVNHSRDSKVPLLEPSLNQIEDVECYWSKSKEWADVGDPEVPFEDVEMSTGDMLVLQANNGKRVAHHLVMFLNYRCGNKACPRYIHSVIFSGVLIEDSLPQGFEVSSLWRVTATDLRGKSRPLDTDRQIGITPLSGESSINIPSH